MDWNDHEKQALLDTHNESEDEREQVWMTARRAVELVAARGGTMTADDLSTIFKALHQYELPGWVGGYAADLEQHLAVQGATVATLQAKVEEVEKERDTQFKDFKARSDDYHRTISRMASERDRDFVTIRDLRAEVERLKGRKWIQCTSVSNECLGGCASMAEHDRYRHRELAMEVENLRPLVVLHEDMTRLRREAESRARVAESSLAAIRERASDVRRLGNEAWGAHNGYTTEEKHQRSAKAVAKWVLDGDAPQEAKPKIAINLPVTPDLIAAADRAALGLRYPCSPTCTHDDAATPGHPQRVKMFSDAVVRGLEGTRTESGPEPAKEGSEAAREVVQSGEEQYAEGYNDGWRDAIATVEQRVRKALENASAEVLAVVGGATP